MKTPISDKNVIHRVLSDDGTFPNNDRCPLLLYPSAVDMPARDPARVFEKLFERHGWTGCWRNGIFGYHHYHSTAHEVLGVYGGGARVQLGGSGGPTFDIQAGDVIVIPAGVAHKNLGSGSGFGVVGAYPADQNPDMNYGKAGERPQADDNIAGVTLPQLDPVFGNAGPLIQLWRETR